MNEANALIVRRAWWLWAGTFLLIAFNLFAAMHRGKALTLVALALTGCLAIAGVAFGIWAGRTLSRARSKP